MTELFYVPSTMRIAFPASSCFLKPTLGGTHISFCECATLVFGNSSATNCNTVLARLASHLPTPAHCTPSWSLGPPQDSPSLTLWPHSWGGPRPSTLLMTGYKFRASHNLSGLVIPQEDSQDPGRCSTYNQFYYKRARTGPAKWMLT